MCRTSWHYGHTLACGSAELARLAAEQERSLRDLITSSHPAPLASGGRDLRARLLLLESNGVSVVTPATPVEVTPRVADEVDRPGVERWGFRRLSRVDEVLGHLR